jgi:hypothetical protein
MQTNLAEKRTLLMPSLRPGKAFLVEKFGPVAFGILMVLGVAWLPSLWILRASWHDLILDKAVDIQLGTLACLIAIVAFLPAIEDKTIIRKLKQWGWYKLLIAYVKESIAVSIVALFLTLAIIVVPDGWKANVRVDRALSSAWWGMIGYSLAATLRIVNLSVKSLLAE